MNARQAKFTSKSFISLILCSLLAAGLMALGKRRFTGTSK